MFIFLSPSRPPLISYLKPNEWAMRGDSVELERWLMARRLRALTTITENLGLIPFTYMAAKNCW